MNISRFTTFRRDGGFALLETLIAFLVLAVGLLALLSFHGTTQKIGADAKTRAEAVALAEDKLQQLESFLIAGDPRVAEDSYSATVTGQLTDYTLEWEVTDDPDQPNLKNVEVTARWTDRDNVLQAVEVGSVIRSVSPTEGVGDFITLVSAAINSSGGGGIDIIGGDPGQGGDDTDPSDPTDPTDPGDEEPPGDGEVVVITQQLTISGQLTGTNAATLDADVSIQNTSIDPEGVYSGNCIRPTNKSFSCTVIYANATGWSGTIELGTNKVFCATRTNTLVLIYTNITTNQSDSIIVANNAGQCG